MIKHKQAQLFFTVHGKEIRHWIVIFIGIALLTLALISYDRGNEQRAQLKTLAEQNKSLSEDNKKLNEQSQGNDKRTQKHIDCVAQIFAQYTHDFVPVTIKDLDSCTLVTSSASQTSPAKPSTASPQPSSTSSPNTAPAPQPSQSEISPPPEPKTLDCKVDLLGLHLGCP